MSIARIHEGDRSKAICPDCGKVVGTTFVRRDVSVGDSRKRVAENILVAVCDACGEVVAIPSESTAAICEANRDV
ncbi:hypothetical protein [Cupriavidus pauculus]|uniref:Uncharacterized protein n=1 Tax=Cupriavidus pauculus TaxID=82633 RepID=A0A3G8H0H6_9BURK|nr:hypothetical protein [Cupriavidus pauculus]AZG13799.1 hypothetical protein EHF44_10255 [Cupriavidus pauculus]